MPCRATGKGILPGDAGLRRRTRRWRSAWCLLTLLLIPGCTEETGDPAPLDAKDPLATAAVRGLEQAGRCGFVVLESKVLGGSKVTMVDGQHYKRDLFAVEIAGRIRFNRDVTVPTREEISSAVGTPGWTLARSLEEIERLNILGPGKHPEGDEREVHVRAMFGRHGADWQFRTFEVSGARDHDRRPPGPEESEH